MPSKTSRRIFAIGDIHGCLAALLRLDRELGFAPGDTVITLGDYVNRGPDSKGVIDYMLALAKRCRLVALRGNHEVMTQQARGDAAIRARWLDFGGRETLASYGADTLEALPPAHWAFIDLALPYFELESDIFAHAFPDPALPLERQTDEALYWKKYDTPLRHRSGKRLICGHTSQKTGVPRDDGSSLCIDTWAYGEGWLTCLDVRSNHYWQANQSGALRDGRL